MASSKLIWAAESAVSLLTTELDDAADGAIVIDAADYVKPIVCSAGSRALQIERNDRARLQREVARCQSRRVRPGLDAAAGFGDDRSARHVD